MRKILRILALLLALSLLCACAPQAEPEAQPEPAAPPDLPDVDEIPEPAAPEAFGLAYEAEAGFNPYGCMSLCNRTVLSLLYEPLFTVDASFHAAPYLVETYAASGDGRTHTLTLRENAAFSDGSPVTAADAAASIQAARGSAYYGARLEHIADVTPTDDHILTITTDAACGGLDALLNIYVVKSGTAADTVPVGSGPYCLKNGSLHRSDWWRTVTPPLSEETVSLIAVSSPTNVRDAFEYGQITLAAADPNVGARIAYHADFELWNNATTIMQYVGFNLNSTVFSKNQVRAAVTYAVDRDAIAAATAAGFAAAAVLPASPYAAVYDQRLADSYAYNPAALSDALQTAGYTPKELPVDPDGEEIDADGVMLVCSASEQRVAAAQAIVDSLAAAGLRLELRALPYDDYLDALDRGEFDAYYGEVRLRPDFDLSVFFDAAGNLSYGSIADSDLARLCDLAVENAGNVYDLHAELMNRGLLCPVLFKTYAVYTARGRITNLTPCLDGIFLMPMAS